VQNFDTKKGKAADGDQVVIDFKGLLDGEAFEGGTAEDYPLVLGSNSFIPGFEEQLIGAKKGEEKKLDVTFPEEYGAEHLAGKAVVFEVTVKEVKKPVPAEIDDEMAKKYGAEDLDCAEGPDHRAPAGRIRRRRARGDEAQASGRAGREGELRAAARAGRGRGRADRPPALARGKPAGGGPRPPRDRIPPRST
jgi:hypothetical protein